MNITRLANKITLAVTRDLREAIKRGLELKGKGDSLSDISRILSEEFPILHRSGNGRRVMNEVRYDAIQERR